MQVFCEENNKKARDLGSLRAFNQTISHLRQIN